MEQLTYFILTRKIFESAIWRDDPHILKLFIYLIGNARHSKIPKKYNGFEIKRGELVTSLSLISDNNEFMKNGRLQTWSRSKVSRMLNALVEQKYITLLSDTYGTHISICKYDTYQKAETYRANTSATVLNINCNGSATEVNTNKKDKNDNKEKKIKIIDSANIPLVNLKNNIQNNTEYTTEELFEYIWQEYPKRDGKKSSLRNFNATIKNENDFLDLCKSVNNYLHTDTVRKGYIKNGSTFFNNWKDFIEPSTNGFHKIKDDLEPEKF